MLADLRTRGREQRVHDDKELSHIGFWLKWDGLITVRQPYEIGFNRCCCRLYRQQLRRTHLENAGKDWNRNGPPSGSSTFNHAFVDVQVSLLVIRDVSSGCFWMLCSMNASRSGWRR